ncbi:hypothetical protein GQ600_20007 [Phytophthora cactorum]|nr:hypothetical protein GQ600_20007 [Phytophthora cactorum]
MEASKYRNQALLANDCSRSIFSTALMQKLQLQGSILESSPVSFKLTNSLQIIPQLKRDSVIILKFEALSSVPNVI